MDRVHKKMVESFIKLNRKIMRSEVYRSTPVVRELFIWLLLNVGWQKKENEEDVKELKKKL